MYLINLLIFVQKDIRKWINKKIQDAAVGSKPTTPQKTQLEMRFYKPTQDTIDHIFKKE